MNVMERFTVNIGASRFHIEAVFPFDARIPGVIRETRHFREPSGEPVETGPRSSGHGGGKTSKRERANISREYRVAVQTLDGEDAPDPACWGAYITEDARSVVFGDGYEIRRKPGSRFLRVYTLPQRAGYALETALRLAACEDVFERGGLAAHASCVSVDIPEAGASPPARRGAIMLVGPSGDGKTTAARAFLLSNHAHAELVADDLVLALPSAHSMGVVGTCPGDPAWPGGPVDLPLWAVLILGRGPGARMVPAPMSELLRRGALLPPATPDAREAPAHLRTHVERGHAGTGDAAGNHTGTGDTRSNDAARWNAGIHAEGKTSAGARSPLPLHGGAGAVLDRWIETCRGAFAGQLIWDGRTDPWPAMARALGDLEDASRARCSDEASAFR